MFHVILIRSRSGMRAVDRMEAQRRVHKACAATGATVTKITEARRFSIDARDGTRMQVYDPPSSSAKGKRTESVLDTTFDVASLPVAELLQALAGEMRCASLVAGSSDIAVPELDLMPTRSAEPVSAQDFLDFIQQCGRVPARPSPAIPASVTKPSNE